MKRQSYLLIGIVAFAGCAKTCATDPRVPGIRDTVAKVRVAAEARHRKVADVIDSVVQNKLATDGPCPIPMPPPAFNDAGMVSALETMIATDPLRKNAQIVEPKGTKVSPVAIHASMEADHITAELDYDQPQYDALATRARDALTMVDEQWEMVVMTTEWTRPTMGEGAFDVLPGRIVGMAYLFHKGAVVCAAPVDATNGPKVEYLSGQGASGLLGAANKDLEIRAVHQAAVALTKVKAP